ERVDSVRLRVRSRELSDRQISAGSDLRFPAAIEPRHFGEPPVFAPVLPNGGDNDIVNPLLFGIRLKRQRPLHGLGEGNGMTGTGFVWTGLVTFHPLWRGPRCWRRSLPPAKRLDTGCPRFQHRSTSLR